MTDTLITIIGGGVVGLAIAEELSSVHNGVFLFERHSTFGQETSSRSSEVIHAGIYYPAGSLKASLCITGKKLLYDYCEKHDVPYRKCGKLIVATSPEEIPVIDEILERARRNGVDDMEIADRGRIESMEPAVFALKALYSPSTGIIDSHSLMKRYETNAINNGCQVVYGSEITGIRKSGEGYAITVKDKSGDLYEFTSRIVINAAGLNADNVSAMAGISDERLRIAFCKGEYFRVKPPKNRLIGRLIYPVPHHNMEGIGIHVTIDIAGGVKLGPDVQYLGQNLYDYTLTPSKQDAFWKSARKFLPWLGFDDIVPEMAGIRPKIQKPGQDQQDYYIMEETQRGLPGFINLVGMESPALTSSIAIAKYVSPMVKY